MLAKPVFITGDFNVRLDRPDDVSARKLFAIFDAYDLTCRVNEPTHDRNGLLDVVVSRNDIAIPEVDVLDVGFSNHRLVCWTSNLAKPPPVYTTSTYRSLRRIDVTSFLEELRSSALCTANDDGDIDVEQLATLYDDVINDIADRLVQSTVV